MPNNPRSTYRFALWPVSEQYLQSHWGNQW